MKKSVKKLETYLGRLIRDIERKFKVKSEVSLEKLISISNQLLEKGKQGNPKIYSIHEPDVKCISKGKSGKRYEFGQKVSISVTNKSNWIVGVSLLENNPYDGHSLVEVAKSIEKVTNVKLKEIHVDKGYRGHKYTGDSEVHISGLGRKKVSLSLKKRKKRRSAVEPKIGHLKSDHRMGRSYLKGTLGDEINCILASAGCNFRKILNKLREILFFYFLRLFYFSNFNILCKN